MRRRAIIALLAAAVTVCGYPASAGAKTGSSSSPAPASKQDRAKYVGVRYAAKKAGLKVGPKIDPRAHDAHSHAWRTRVLRAKIAARQAAKARSATGGLAGVLRAIRECESGGNYSAVDPTGTYRGAYQFDRGTWAEVGGSGDPAAAPPAEQDRRAAMLYERAGPGRWPNCGR